MLPPHIETSVQARWYYDALYADHIASGRYHAFTFPWSFIGMVAIPVFSCLTTDTRASDVLCGSRFSA